MISTEFVAEEYSKRPAARAEVSEDMAAEFGVESTIFQVCRGKNRHLFGSNAATGRPDYVCPITRATLLEKVCLGQSIRVLEIKSRGDVTYDILLQLLVDCEKRRPQFSQTLLCEINRLSGAGGDERRVFSDFLNFIASAYEEPLLIRGHE